MSKPNLFKTLPKQIPSAQLADHFSTFFADKIKRIKDTIKESQSDDTTAGEFNHDVMTSRKMSQLSMML